jgi:hypothetical protein
MQSTDPGRAKKEEHQMKKIKRVHRIIFDNDPETMKEYGFYGPEVENYLINSVQMWIDQVSVGKQFSNMDVEADLFKIDDTWLKLAMLMWQPSRREGVKKRIEFVKAKDAESWGANALP